ncbi:MAG: prepilin-type N-terminal cleavage/methylation domain-containing protein [Bacteriovorax sp.]|nr:prepilin-type N-terminal cleavage/methylation domain-containing protein [Bacteriovorax sp.]
MSPALISNDGFTLIEVLIAITILAFISFSTYKMVDTNTDTKDRVIKEDRRIVQTLTAIGRLDGDISQMVNPLYSYSKLVPTASTNPSDVYADNNTNANGSFEGKTNNGALIPQFKSEDKSTILFFTQANRRKTADSKESRFAWIKYSLKSMEPDPDNPDEKTSGLYELVRQSISQDIYNPSLDWSKPKPQIVMEKIKNAEFAFWDERGKKYTTSLQDLNENKNLIRSIQLKMTWVDDNGNEQKLEKTFRVLAPYFNTKQDDLKTGPGANGAYGGGAAPPGVPNPDVLAPGDGVVQ